MTVREIKVRATCHLYYSALISRRFESGSSRGTRGYAAQGHATGDLGGARRRLARAPACGASVGPEAGVRRLAGAALRGPSIPPGRGGGGTPPGSPAVGGARRRRRFLPTLRNEWPVTSD